MVIRVAKGAISATLRKGSADLVNYQLIQIELDELLRVVFNIGSHTCCRCCGSGRPKCLLTAALVYFLLFKPPQKLFAVFTCLPPLGNFLSTPMHCCAEPCPQASVRGDKMFIF